MIEPGAAELVRFREVIARRLGLWFDDGRLGFLDEVLRNRCAASGRAPADVLDGLAAGGGDGTLRALAPELTVGETFFHRNPDQFRAFAESALPDRVRARAATRTLRVLSAGCASGEEPFTVALLLRERAAELAGWRIEIRGVDVNPAALARAAAGRYSAWSLRETPADVLERWFVRDGREFVLDEAVRAAVTFEERNLAGDDPALWAPGTWDVVFCRNVIMYFTPARARALAAGIAAGLAPGGYLFLGHAETLRGLSQEFHLRHTHGTFYYQRRGAPGEAVDEPSPAPDAASGGEPPPLVLAVDGSASWVEAIARATARIEALVERPLAGEAGSREAAPGAARSRLEPAFELLKRERFGDALDEVARLPAADAGDAEVRLLRAVLLAHRGAPAEAERVCAELLRHDELNAGAHYVMALCREGAGDAGGAAEHDGAAVYLDPAFAMPRLHLGLLARRRGDAAAARRELVVALGLLRLEEPSRLLLFGGGFGREALLALCRSELAACGGAE